MVEKKKKKNKAKKEKSLNKAFVHEPIAVFQNFISDALNSSVLRTFDTIKRMKMKEQKNWEKRIKF